jgi:hypothetical protein
MGASERVGQLRAWQVVADGRGVWGKRQDLTPGFAIQRTPSIWRASHDITRIVGHPHGWFSTWKKIKEKINEYIAIADANLDARRAKLDEINPLIAEWEANRKHTAASKEQRVKAIRTDMPELQTYIQREYTEIAIAADVVTGGHAETRHGADLTDQQLQDRLTTGNDRAGVNAPADVSSRFESHELLVRTRNDAVNQLNTARTNTMVHFAPLLNDFAYKCLTFENTPAGPAKGVAGVARNNARAAINTEARGIQRPSPNLLQVTVQNPMAGGAVPVAQIPNRVADMVQIRQRYTIVIHHGQDLGRSFQGTGPHGLIGAAWNPHPATAHAAAPQSTLTILQPGVNPLSTAPVAAAWPLVTHYPTTVGPADLGINF